MFNSISTQANKLVSLTKRTKKISKTKVLSITSGKGGVGKSTLSANIAYLLAKSGKKVVLLDADIGLANLQVLLNIKPTKTIYDYIDNRCDLEEIILDTMYKNVSLVAGASGHQYSLENSSMIFSRVVEDIVSLNQYDVLLIDTGAGLSQDVQEILFLSDTILAITTTDPSALTDLYALIKMVSMKKDSLLICFNYTLKYETGATIINSIIKLAQKNKLNRKFMVQYLGNISESKTISTTNRLRKLFADEFAYESVTVQLELVVENLILNME